MSLQPANTTSTVGIDGLVARQGGELRDRWAMIRDSSDDFNALNYWAANKRRLNSFSTATAA